MIDKTSIEKFIEYADPQDTLVHHCFRESMPEDERQLWLTDFEEALAQLLVDGWIHMQKSTSNTSQEKNHGK